MMARFSLCFGSSRRRRIARGITLLEVLISMFVLLVGLLGIASLLPVGQHYVAKATKFSRGDAVGHAALNSIQIEGMLRRDLWIQYNNIPVQASAFARVVDGQVEDQIQIIRNGLMFPTLPKVTLVGGGGVGAKAVVDRLNKLGGIPIIRVVSGGKNYTSAPKVIISDNRGFAVDPLGIATGDPKDFGIGWFPYSQNPKDLTVPRLTRVTLSGAMWLDVARPRRFFESHDDLSLEIPDQDDLPTKLTFKSQDPEDATTRIRRQYQGDFSWMFTVVPGVDSDDDLYTVSVVVFQKRVLDVASGVERVVQAMPIGTGWGGGDWVLRSSTGDGSDLKEIRPGDWVMLSGWTGNPADLASRRGIFKWYRVVSLDDKLSPPGPQTNAWTRLITLTGPDWDVSNIIQTHVSLFEGAVAVYERTLPLDVSSVYSQN